jgi:molybdate transport repressor ModE-like protein
VNVAGWASVELRHLLALRAIAESGSFHKAAARLGYTQSAISQQVAALEQLVGHQLVERPGGTRPVRLTPSGEVLLRHARAVFTQIGAAQADLAAHRAGEAPRLRVGSFQSVGATVVPALMARLAKRRPGLEIDLREAISDDELFGLLAVGELDLTFAMLPVPDGPFAFVELFADPFIALVSATSPLAHGSSVTLRELGSCPLITAKRCRYSMQLTTVMRERGLAATVVHRSDDDGTVMGLVAAGAGVALVPKLTAAGAGPGVCALTIDEQVLPRRVGLAWREDRLGPHGRETFAAEAAAVCRQLGLTG